VPIVIARGKITRDQIRKARSASVCSGPIARLASALNDPSAVAALEDGNGSDGGLVAAVKAPLEEGAGVVGSTVKGLSDRVADAATAGPLSDPFVITLIGALALASALLGGLVLVHLARIAGFRDPDSRERLD
jgi:hypothetical protein